MIDCAGRFSPKLYAFVFVPAFVAELSLTLRLLVKGVDEARWWKSARGAAGTPRSW